MYLLSIIYDKVRTIGIFMVLRNFTCDIDLIFFYFLSNICRCLSNRNLRPSYSLHSCCQEALKLS
ncbi:hypothetical protein SPOG_05775 [Schizosaccharomyces cryophilus OY26]|uniref:Uncharacterized protein n=1 Tax=Schizosaccharomyces cryophilus (strain OY26 / ATCC MYA-4695 / CBS 11777 / NBRC 106824 / NRRL Y48691) TaxID=653667 RepID=S9WWZ4_SCHCR|nr:uncharacterized protein SPOG_05775 [Schizosaccharomyces cryophilus OY26]EPY49257.1 hypothetical protein SPOG_05775 [Schizosaccharomyces cryophilus OY26]